MTNDAVGLQGTGGFLGAEISEPWANVTWAPSDARGRPVQVPGDRSRCIKTCA